MMVTGMVLPEAMVLGTAMPVMMAVARGVNRAVGRVEERMLSGGVIWFSRWRVGGGVETSGLSD